MPCINPAVIAHLFNSVDNYDAVIPSWNPDMLEPLHAVYRRTALLTYLESHDSLSLRAMVRSLSARYVPVDELKIIDPDLKTFTNINKLEDLERINTPDPESPGADSVQKKLINNFVLLWQLTTEYINIWNEINTNYYTRFLH